MNAKKFARGPLLWILLPIIILIFGLSFLRGGGVQTIPTSEGIELLRGETIQSAEVTEGYQRVELELTEPYTDAEGEDRGDHVQFVYVEQQGQEIVDLIAAAEPEDGYNSVVPSTPWWSSLL